MALTQYRSRLHLLPAKGAPTLVVIQRKRSKLFHLLVLDTRRLEVTHGSWFRGKLYPKRCDISFDGRYLVYLAMGVNGQTWNGVCALPFLRTLSEAENMGTWFGGGYFAGPRLLRSNGWGPGTSHAQRKTGGPLHIEPFLPEHGGEDLGVLYPRLQRDGFQRLGPHWGEQRRLPTASYRVAVEGDDGWGSRPTRRHPMLKLRFVGYLEHGYTFAFWLDEHPGLLDGSTWACWDSGGDLWVTRPGMVDRYTVDDLGRGVPSFSLDVEPFEPLIRPGP